VHYTKEPIDYPYRPSVNMFFKSLAQYWNHKATAVLYQLRASGVRRKTESTVNTLLPFSFSTRPLTVNNNSGATGIDITDWDGT